MRRYTKEEFNTFVECVYDGDALLSYRYLGIDLEDYERVEATLNLCQELVYKHLDLDVPLELREIAFRRAKALMVLFAPERLPEDVLCLL